MAERAQKLWQWGYGMPDGRQQKRSEAIPFPKM